MMTLFKKPSGAGWRAAILSGGLILAFPSQAGEAEIEAIARIYQNPATPPAQFSQRFLDVVPLKQIEGVVEGMRETYGPNLAVTQTGEDYAIETPTHRIPVQITLNGDGQVEGLLFKPAQRLTATIAQTAELLDAVEGTVSYIVQSDGATILERGGDEALAVGSAFKLGVLTALREAIAAGTHSWDEVVRLEDGDRSLPSGRLQDYPAGSPFTLHTLAAAMIAESDNTATDALIRIVGRERVAEALGIETLLTTRDFFTLKADPALSARYRDADGEGRRAILAEIAGRPLPGVAQVTGTHDAGVEWYVPAETLCALATAVRDIDVFAINPGPVEPGDWKSVAYKGGSETGVLNLTAALAGRDGRSHCVSVTVNSDSAVDLIEVTGLFARLAAQLAGGGGE